ncbi:MAG: class I SAM-dependent methyltransferase [Verrucomicrobia bacterium]|nr:class I SAM-dependent methyltransferase [Cytophagales bacterium]
MKNKRFSPPVWSNLSYSLSTLRKNLLVFVEKISREHQVKKVLDLGCGSSPYKPILESFGFQYYGADIARTENVDYIVRTDNTVEDVTDASFDMILSSQVLEHVASPADYLQECNRLLPKNGVLLLSTHGHWIFHPDPNDYWRWTNEGLKKTVEAAGFKVVAFSGIMGVVPTCLQIIQDSIALNMPRFIREIIIVFFQFTIFLSDKLTSQSSRDKDAGIFILTAIKQ